jgi:hypothetical protein
VEANTNRAMRRAAATFVVLLLTLAGCIPVPPFETSAAKPDIRAIVGDQSSGKPIRPGVPREQVVSLLGQSMAVADDGALLYGFLMYRGQILGAYAPAAQRLYCLRLRYGSDNRLGSYELFRGPWEDTFGFSEIDANEFTIQSLLHNNPELVSSAQRGETKGEAETRTWPK